MSRVAFDRIDNELTVDLDITHINAVDKFDDGDYLFSSRHTDSLFKVRASQTPHMLFRDASADRFLRIGLSQNA